MPQNKRIVTQYEKDVIQANLAEDACSILKMSRATLTKICRMHGITFVRLKAPPSDAGRMKRKSIQQDYKAGLTVKELSVKYDVFAWDVRRILRLRYQGETLKYLNAQTLSWLEHQCPNGMNLNEFAAVLIKDAYLEDQG
jgi:hypothetical protein